MFESNVKGATDAGLAVGAYIFSQAVTKEDVLEEAMFLMNLVDGYDLSLPLVMDYEVASEGAFVTAINNGTLTAEEMTENVSFFANLVRTQGYEACVYANASFLNNYLDLSKLSSICETWLAHYTTYTDFGSAFTMWQCTDSSNVDGITVNGTTANVDKNFWYINPDGITSVATERIDEEGEISTGTRMLSEDCADDDSVIGERISLEDCDIELEDDSYRLSGDYVEPEVTVTYDGEELEEGTDYTLAFIDNNEEDTAYVVVRGVGAYKDIACISFEIK